MIYGSRVHAWAGDLSVGTGITDKPQREQVLGYKFYYTNREGAEHGGVTWEALNIQAGPDWAFAVESS